MKNLSLSLRRWLAVAAAVAVAIALTTAAAHSGSRWHFWHDDHGAEHMAKRMVDRIDKKLDLSSAQESELTAILTESVEKRRQLRGQRYESLQALWQQETLSAEELQAALQQHAEREDNKAAARGAHIALMAETMAKVHAVLTPEQRSAAAAAMQDMRLLDGRYGHGGKHGGRHGKRHGKHDCDHD